MNTGIFIMEAVTGWTWITTATGMMKGTRTGTAAWAEAGQISEDVQIQMNGSGTITTGTDQLGMATVMMMMTIIPTVIQDASVIQVAVGMVIMKDIPKRLSVVGTIAAENAATVHQRGIVKTTGDQEALMRGEREVDADADGLVKAEDIQMLLNADGTTDVNPWIE